MKHKKLKDEKVSSEIDHNCEKQPKYDFQKGCDPIVNNRLFKVFLHVSKFQYFFQFEF